MQGPPGSTSRSSWLAIVSSHHDRNFQHHGGHSNFTLAVVSIGAKNFDYRVRARGYQIVRQNGGADVQVDLYARLNGETGGNIVSASARARRHGATRSDRCMPPPGSVDGLRQGDCRQRRHGPLPHRAAGRREQLHHVELRAASSWSTCCPCADDQSRTGLDPEHPSTDGIHTEPAEGGNSAFTTPFTPAALVQIGIQLIEGFLAKVVTALTGGLIARGFSVRAVVRLGCHDIARDDPGAAAVTDQCVGHVLGSFPIVGNVVTDLASAFGLLHDNTTVAQSRATSRSRRRNRRWRWHRQPPRRSRPGRTCSTRTGSAERSTHRRAPIWAPTTPATPTVDRAPGPRRVGQCARHVRWCDGAGVPRPQHRGRLRDGQAGGQLPDLDGAAGMRAGSPRTVAASASRCVRTPPGTPRSSPTTTRVSSRSATTCRAPITSSVRTR
jgi:hypothetical protein